MNNNIILLLIFILTLFILCQYQSFIETFSSINNENASNNENVNRDLILDINNTIKSHISALEQYNPKISLAYNALAFASMEIFNEEKILSDSVYNEINTNLIKSIKKTLDYYKK